MTGYAGIFYVGNLKIPLAWLGDSGPEVYFAAKRPTRAKLRGPDVCCANKRPPQAKLACLADFVLGTRLRRGTFLRGKVPKARRGNFPRTPFFKSFPSAENARRRFVHMFLFVTRLFHGMSL